MTENLEAWLALDAVKGLGPARFNALLQHYGSPREVFACSDRELTGTAGLDPAVVASLRSPALLEHARALIERARTLSITIITSADAHYPALLSHIPVCPPLLYARGDLSVLDRPCVGIVGTRDATLYGKNATVALVDGLVSAGVTIVSGMANGIDTVAHESCLERGGATVAVLGCGIDYRLGSARMKLAAAIARSGLVLSEFPPATPAEPYHFPRRNRIISGLSLAVVVVEAGARSGATITANYALAQGREVCVVPGPIFSEKSEGTFELLRGGATPVRSAQDILDQIPSAHASVPVTAVQPIVTAAFPFEQLNAQERSLVQELDGEGKRVDQLAELTGLGLNELFAHLLNLELKGVVQQLPGRQYVRAR